MKLLVCAALAMAMCTAGCGKQSGSEGGSAVQSPPTAPASAPVAPPAPLVAKGPWDGPLGVKMGLSVDELRQSIKLEDSKRANLFLSETAPSPHDAFESYTFTAPPGTGLCKVSAIGKTIRTSAFGNELRSEYASLKAALAEKYGKPTNDFDFLRHGSIWNEPRDWMMGLFKKDRTLSAFWDGEPDKTGVRKITLPNDLAVVSIDLTAEGPESGYITIAYAFSNEDACVAEIKKVKNKSL